MLRSSRDEDTLSSHGPTRHVQGSKKLLFLCNREDIICWFYESVLNLQGLHLVLIRWEWGVSTNSKRLMINSLTYVFGIIDTYNSNKHTRKLILYNNWQKRRLQGKTTQEIPMDSLFTKFQVGRKMFISFTWHNRFCRFCVNIFLCWILFEDSVKCKCPSLEQKRLSSKSRQKSIKNDKLNSSLGNSLILSPSDLNYLATTRSLM